MNLHSRSEKMTNGQEKHESLGKKGIGVKLELFLRGKKLESLRSLRRVTDRMTQYK